MNTSQYVLLDLIRASLFGTEPAFEADVDWNAVLKEAEDQTVVALAADAVPVEAAAAWQIPVARNKMHFLQVLTVQTNLVKLFREAGIPLAILKGCAAAMYYPAPIQRAMGDIDFIVPRDRFEESRRLMEENGYEFVHETKDKRDYAYEKDHIIIELHHHYSVENWDIEPQIMEGLTRAVTCEVYKNEFPALPTMINGLVLLDHVRRHLYSGIGIRQIIDWMMFVHASLSDDAWTNEFAELARGAGLETLALTMTKMCRLWFGLPDEITWCDSADEDTARSLMELVFDFGNFGVKERGSDRPLEGVTVTARKEGLFRYLQRTGEATWKAYHRHHFLRPFAWFYQICRFIKRGVAALFRGERLSAKDIAKGNERADIYHRLGVDK